MKHIKIWTLIIILLAVDLLSKYFFYNQKTLTNFLITPTFNTGVARSLPIPLFLVIIITIGVLIGIYWIFINKKIGRIFLGFFIAGTLGNLIDRVRLGGVRDFININVFNFPIFNVADILLNIGIIGLLVQTFFLEKKK
ncbi:MAG: signal peptidase II [candidate division SR1 bacterium]|nr:signal peptidase II [candidate division SR1 bacterium]